MIRFIFIAQGGLHAGQVAFGRNILPYMEKQFIFLFRIDDPNGVLRQFKAPGCHALLKDLLHRTAGKTFPFLHTGKIFQKEKHDITTQTFADPPRPVSNVFKFARRSANGGRQGIPVDCFVILGRDEKRTG